MFKDEERSTEKEDREGEDGERDRTIKMEERERERII